MTPIPWRGEINELYRQATLCRKRGDALRRANETKKAAEQYQAGLSYIDKAFQILKDPTWYRLGELGGNKLPQSEQLDIAKDLVEAWGVRGGLLRRLGQSRAALDSYSEGANLEKQFVPTSTYNRVNVVKYALLAGLKTLAESEQDIRDLESLLSDQLAKNQELGDSGWTWADLGDCRALLGDVSGAERAYRTFIEKSGSNAPNITLEVLRDTLSKLDESLDPRADIVRQSLRALEQRLA